MKSVGKRDERKTAIISDIHGNPEALETVLDDIRANGCSRIICLGDIVGYGYDPNACIEICRKECDLCLMGNHEAGVVGLEDLDDYSLVAREGILRDRKRICEADKKWLSDRVYQHVEKLVNGANVSFTHGACMVTNAFEYVDNLVIASYELDLMKDASLNLALMGHTHCAEAYRRSENKVLPENVMADEARTFAFQITGNNHTIVNVGSVGYPRNQPFSSYAILEERENETGEGECCVCNRVVRFNFEAYIENLRRENIAIPAWMARWEGEYL